MIGELIKLSPEDLPKRRERPKKLPLWRRKWVRATLAILTILAVAGWFGLQAYLKPFQEKAEEFDLGQLYKLEEATLILDRNGVEIGRIGNENRMIIPFADINKKMIDALVAQEDSRFWTHDGVDKVGIARAAWQNIKAGRLSPGSWTQGASTIPQQLARQAFGASSGFNMFERSKERKFVEWFLAQRIVRHFPKRTEILDLYLNRIYFGEGFYGVEAAAQGYFGKTTAELDYEECATLAGLIKNPTRYSPFNNPDLSKKERDAVLERMHTEKMLSREDADKYKARPLTLNPAAQTGKGAGWAQKEIQKEVDQILEQLGLSTAQGKGFKITTTIDSGLQKRAEDSMKARLAEIERYPEYPRQGTGDGLRETPAEYEARLAEFVKQRRPNSEKPQPAYLQGGALVMDNTNGAVLAMVGGRDFSHSEINHTRIKRPAGTVFVPFVYAAAFEGDFFPGSRVSDEPMDNTRVMVGGTTGMVREWWGRENFSAAFTDGTVALRQALAAGHNNGAARLGLEPGVGLGKVADFAKRAGFGEIAPEPSSLLGRSETTLRDVVMGYSSFARGGERPSAYRMVTRIMDTAGRVIYERPPQDTPVRVTDPVTAWMVTSCLQDALHTGTGSPSAEYGLLPETLAAGKTGSFHNSSDIWFAGYNSAVTCAVWLGLDRPRPVYQDALSSRTALPVWTDIMNATVAKYKPEELRLPAGLQKITLCRVSGQLGTDACLEKRADSSNLFRQRLVSSSYTEYIRLGQKVDRFCEVHRHAEIQIPVIGGEQGAAPFAPAGVSTQAPAAASVLLKNPTIIGEDPYKSVIAAVNKGEEPTEAKPETPAPSEEPGIVAPLIDPNASRPLILPNPGKATVD